MLQPLARRTWAPRGQTPIHYAWHRHDRLSVIAALCVSPRARRLTLPFWIQQRNVRAPDVAIFVRQLHRTLGRPIILVCDRYNVHKKAIRLLQEQGANWLHVELLPAYAPDLNPVEAAWNHAKHATLANFLPDDVDHLFDAVGNTLDDQAFKPQLKRSFFHWAQLPL